VWTEAGLEKTLAVADIKEHGKINEDSENLCLASTSLPASLSTFLFLSVHFGAFSLSPDGRYLLYIAERKKQKSSSYFSKTSSSKEDPPPVKVRGGSGVRGGGGRREGERRRVRGGGVVERRERGKGRRGGRRGWRKRGGGEQRFSITLIWVSF
jgi:hypothetical protein